MKDDRPLPQLLLGALIAATLFYVLGFALNEHLRARRGPWEVTFTTSPDGEPQLTVEQPALGIRNITLTFAGEFVTNHPSVTLRFDTPHMPLPFGRVKYDDLTYLPGVVTFDIFGHEIELLPRVLYVNRNEVDWTLAGPITLQPEDRLKTP